VVKSEVNVHKEMGPVSLAFEIPMYNISQLQVQHLKIVERNKSYNPHRWVRCLTQYAQRRSVHRTHD
jgi:AP-4 complex subunit mu-1